MPVGDSNLARFTIDGTVGGLTPSEDANGNRGYDVATSEVLTLTLENNPALGALTVKFDLPDATDSDAPMATPSADALTFVENGLDSITLGTGGLGINDAVTINIPAGLKLQSWVVRCTVTSAQGTFVFERLVAMRETNLRATVPAERNEYQARSWADAIYELMVEMTLQSTTGAAFLNQANTFLQPNTFEQEILLDEADREEPRITSSLAPIGSNYFLLAEFKYNATECLRIYACPQSTSWLLPGFVITLNARWSSLSWSSDDTGEPSKMFVFNNAGQVQVYHNAATASTWTVLGWDKLMFHLSDTMMGKLSGVTGTDSDDMTFAAADGVVNGDGGDVILEPGEGAGTGDDGAVKLVRDVVEWVLAAAGPTMTIEEQTAAVAGTPMTIKGQTVSGGVGPAELGGGIILAPGAGGGSSDAGEVIIAPEGEGTIFAFKPGNNAAGSTHGFVIALDTTATSPPSDVRGPVIYSHQENDDNEELTVRRTDGIFVGLA